MSVRALDRFPFPARENATCVAAEPLVAAEPREPRGPSGRSQGLRLTAAQRELWSRQSRDPGGAPPVTAAYREIHGPLDPVLFAEALHRTVGEADALRMRIADTPDGPRQRPIAIEPPGHGFPLCAADLRVAEGAEDEEAVRTALAWMRADVVRPFDPADGPLFAYGLFRVGDRRWLWYRRVHRALLDEHGHRLVDRRVAEVYTALAAGDDPGPSPFGRLADLVAEDAAYRDSAARDRDRAYWRNRLTNPATTGDDEEPEGQRQATAHHRATTRHAFPFHLTPEITAGLRELAASVRGSWTGLLLAAQALHLRGATRRDDVVLGLPLTGRTGPAALRVPGTVRNTVPLRLTVTPGTTVAELVRQADDAVREARAHQRYRRADLRRDIGLPAGHPALAGPLADVVPAEEPVVTFAAAPSTLHPLATTPDDPCAVVFRGTPDEGLHIETTTGSPLALRDLLTRLPHVDPHAPLAALSLVPDEDHERALREGNDTAVTVPPTTAIGPFEARAARTPDATALVTADAHLTYADLNTHANRLARHLTTLGLRPGAFAAVDLPPSTARVIALLAILKTGAACWFGPPGPVAEGDPHGGDGDGGDRHGDDRHGGDLSGRSPGGPGSYGETPDGRGPHDEDRHAGDRHSDDAYARGAHDADARPGAPRADAPQGGSPYGGGSGGDGSSADGMCGHEAHAGGPRAGGSHDGDADDRGPRVDAPQSGNPQNGSPLGRSPQNGSPLGRSPQNGSPLGRSPLGRSPLGRSPLGRSPYGEGPCAGRPCGHEAHAGGLGEGNAYGRGPQGGAPQGGAPQGGAPQGGAPQGGTPQGRSLYGGGPYGDGPYTAEPAPLYVLTTASARPTPGVRTVLLDDPALPALLAAHPPVDPARPLTPHHPAYATRTATRQPAVVVPHSALDNRLRWLQHHHPLTPDDRVLVQTPSTPDELAEELLWPLREGATLVLDAPRTGTAPGDSRPDPDASTARRIREHGVTVARFGPDALRRFLDAPEAGECVRLRHVLTGGEPPDPATAGRFRRVLPNAALHHHAGPPEAAGAVHHTCTPDGGTPAGAVRPAWNTRLHVLDPALRPCPPGTPGELYVAGAPLATGYAGHPARTAARFPADPYGPPGTRMYRTGRRALRRADGSVEFVAERAPRGEREPAGGGTRSATGKVGGTAAGDARGDRDPAGDGSPFDGGGTGRRPPFRR
ncbi:AMP-binding protein [Streptomyces huiliensis]|uniref:AMP-binding protein n=1 Tax=Streptomyces huiliensis TaxID=2876027 RepID=UPI001CBAB56D|nr:AMP-binding protein [Streptomyces huiliensis]MBZ4321015.1 AMP-binding protein [Streptomyces huiliensis]